MMYAGYVVYRIERLRASDEPNALLAASRKSPHRIQYRSMTDDSHQQNESQTKDARQAAIDYGIDVSQTDYLLTLTPTERLERHDQALELIRALRQAGIEYYGFDPRLPETPDRSQR